MESQDNVPPPTPPVVKTPVIPKPGKSRGKRKETESNEPSKRKCVSTACIACRKRKSKCDGNLPACAACSSVYYTECVYDPNSDHRRKGVYRKDEKLKTRNTTLEVLIQALLNASEEQVPDLVKQIRTCESLDVVAEELLAQEDIKDEDEEEDEVAEVGESLTSPQPTFENQLSAKMGGLRLEEGSARYIGGTSNLLFLEEDREFSTTETDISTDNYMMEDENPINSWTNVTDDTELIQHLLQMYFTWHYSYFTTLSKSLFYRDFFKGRLAVANSRKTEYCTPLLVNSMLALGCHFTAWPAARELRDDSSTAGDHFFKECKRLIMANDEYEKAKLTTVQALALMSVREAGCGREAKGWVYSGMSFRMACDLGLNLDSGAFAGAKDLGIGEEDIDARRITFWGCFLFDKCWSNYLGRMPQLPMSIITAPKFDVFPTEDAETWVAYTDSGLNQAHAQPARTRALALQISRLCEISNDLMIYFYNPIEQDKNKSKQSDMKKLTEIHGRLEEWKRNLPIEMEPREGGLPSMLVMHMFFQLLYIHLFRPFLKYSQATSPLPPNVSPRRLCTNAAATISKLLRLYKRSHGLRQICNVAVYIAHSACTIHLLNLPDKNAKRDITHGVKHLEEIAESWLCARRTLGILSVLSRQWKVELPDEASAVLQRTDVKFAAWCQDIQSRYTSHRSHTSPASSTARHILQPSPGLFAAPGAALTNVGNIGVGQSRSFAPISSPDTLPPNSAAEASGTYHQHNVSPTPTSVVGQSRSSVDSTASPSAMFGGVDQLLRQAHGGDDWWIDDQRQLANGFSQWPENYDASWAATRPSRPPAEGVIPDEVILQGMLNMSSPRLSNGNADGFYVPGGMVYPNESEWYQ